MMMTGLDYQLTDAQHQAYSRDGALPLRGVVTGSLLARLQAASERARERPGGFWYNIYLWRDDADFRACCMDSALPAIGAQLLQASKVNLLYDQLFIKPPRGEPTPWHHDLPYWPVDGTSVTSIWLALSEVTRRNGGLEFIRGSHLWQGARRTFHVDYDSGTYSDAVSDADDAPALDFDEQRDEFEMLHWDLEPGDAVAFHALTFHHASGNSSASTARRGYALRFMGEEVRYKETEGMNKRVFNPALKTGDIMDSEQYPVVFRREARDQTATH